MLKKSNFLLKYTSFYISFSRFSSAFASKVFMIQPTNFYSNSETTVDNSFMKKQTLSNEAIQQKVNNIDKIYSLFQALKQFKQYTQLLHDAQIQTVIKQQKFADAPDSIFPNNWFSTHRFIGTQKSSLFIYPMKVESRRKEIVSEYVEEMKNNYQEYHDFRLKWVDKGKSLEGTGALIFDIHEKKVYATISQRCDLQVLEDFMNQFNNLQASQNKFKLISFKANDKNGAIIYHTNCIMAVLQKHIVICSETIAPQDRDRVLRELSRSKKIVDLTMEEMTGYGCNILCLKAKNHDKHRVVMSKLAYNSLRKQIQTQLQNQYKLIIPDLQVIEQIGGGSARCMVGQLF